MLNISVNFELFLFVQIGNHFLIAIQSYVFLKKNCIFLTSFYVLYSVVCALDYSLVRQVVVPIQLYSKCFPMQWCEKDERKRQQSSRQYILTKKQWRMGSDSFERSIRHRICGSFFLSLSFFCSQVIRKKSSKRGIAQTYLQLPIRQWGAVNFYLLVLSS